MKRLLSILLTGIILLAFPLASLAEEFFLLRDRYTWGMSMEEIKQQAAQEGLIFEKENEVSVQYQNVPVAGIFAKDLSFIGRPDVGLDQISYIITDDPEEGNILYPLLLEQLTLIYGQPYDIDAEKYDAAWQNLDAHIILRANSHTSHKGCSLSYVRVTPKPTPIPLNADGL